MMTEWMARAYYQRHDERDLLRLRRLVTWLQDEAHARERAGDHDAAQDLTDDARALRRILNTVEGT